MALEASHDKVETVNVDSTKQRLLDSLGLETLDRLSSDGGLIDIIKIRSQDLLRILSGIQSPHELIIENTSANIPMLSLRKGYNIIQLLPLYEGNKHQTGHKDNMRIQLGLLDRALCTLNGIQFAQADASQELLFKYYRSD